MLLLARKRLATLPTSQLVFYHTVNNNGYNTGDVEIELDKRLRKNYKLDKEASKILINKEKKVFKKRNCDLDNYLFSEAKSIKEVLNIFYDEEKDIKTTLTIKEHFNNLSFSELAMLCVIFQEFCLKYSGRTGQLLSRERRIFKKEELALIKKQLTNESALLNYYNFLKKCMLNKFKEYINFDCLDIDMQNEILKNEVKLIDSYLKEIKLNLEQYQNLSFEAYKCDTSIIFDLGVEAYPFSRIRKK